MRSLANRLPLFRDGRQVRVRYQLGEDETLCGLRARLSP